MNDWEGARSLSLFQNVQTGSWAHPTYYSVGTAGSFFGNVRVFTHLHLVPCLRMNGVIPPLPLYAFVVRIATTSTVHVLSQDW